MATNADEVITGAQMGAAAAGAVDPYEKHFEAAGIAKDDADASNTQELSDASAKGGEEGKGERDQGQAADSKAGTGDGKNNDNKQSVDEKGKKDKEPTLAAGDLKLDDGTVVKAGAERRFYEQYRNTQHQLSVESNRSKQFKENYDRLKDSHQRLEDGVRSLHGAEPAQVLAGLNIVRDLQRDPVACLQKLLAEAVAAGYTIQGIGAGVDTAAITKLLETKLGSTNNTVDYTQQIEQETEREITQFYSSFPDAKVHDATLGRVLRDHPEMELSQAYFQLKDAFIQRGLDWSKPLDQQVAASADQTANTKPMPNGRPTVQAEPKEQVNVMHESSDTGDIVKAAMREAGLNI